MHCWQSPWAMMCSHCRPQPSDGLQEPPVMLPACLPARMLPACLVTCLRAAFQLLANCLQSMCTIGCLLAFNHTLARGNGSKREPGRGAAPACSRPRSVPGPALGRRAQPRRAAKLLPLLHVPLSRCRLLLLGLSVAHPDAAAQQGGAIQRHGLVQPRLLPGTEQGQTREHGEVRLAVGLHEAVRTAWWGDDRETAGHQARSMQCRRRRR